MKKILLASCSALILGLMGGAHTAAAEIFNLRQDIAPLDCLSSEVITGVGTNNSLTPQYCDDFDPPTSPNLPDTSAYRDPWTYTGIAIIGVIIALLALLRVSLTLPNR